ncbi:MAG: FAD-binding protein [Helicobacteraceae bacterium]|jgi:L-aspartate oxidase|nr:FAD-binding protein [Helicobacteraceae bacterium]
MQTDVLIVGSGAAALAAARFLPKNMRVLIASKSGEKSTAKRGEGGSNNTDLAQGGIACPIDENDIESHIAETIKAGAGRCDEKAVRTLVTRGFELIRELCALGLPFDRDEKGNLIRAKEAAHSKARVLQVRGDNSGFFLRLFLLDQVSALQRCGAIIDLLIEGDRCYGATFFDGEKIENIYANRVIIASGGIGALYASTTNQPLVLGELQGIAAFRGLSLQDMHFTQFHPTAIDRKDSVQKPLLSEALRGAGATIIDDRNRKFLKDFGENELSPRDRLSRAIFAHIQSGRKVFLDLSAIEPSLFRSRFESADRLAAKYGLKPPISPAFHYSMGGIAVDSNARVLGVKGLYAIGEVASSGVHGANRLASNSLLEALVFAKIAAENIESDFSANGDIKIESIIAAALNGKDDPTALETIRQTLWNRFGVVRQKSAMIEGIAILESLKERDLGVLTRRSLLTAKTIANCAIAETQNVGAHYVKKEAD